MPSPRSMLKCLFLAGILTCIASPQPGPSQESNESKRSAFDVVSIRKVDTTATRVGPYMWRGVPHKPCKYLADRVLCQLSLKELTLEAYQVKDIEFAGPEWMSESLFAFQATMPPHTPQEAARLMLQQALTERFGLKVHHEKRIIPVYALVPGPHGVKLQLADDPAHRKPQAITTPAGLMRPSSFFGGGRFYSIASTLDRLATELNLHGGMGLPVVNMTALTGEYKMDMRWSPSDDPHYTRRGQDPEFAIAVQQQLGLRLEKRKVPYDVLVVDHADRAPTEN